MARVLIIGDSGTIGGALASAMAARGDAVVGVSRRDGLDLRDPGSVDRVLADRAGGFDRMVIATGALQIGADRPEKALRQITAEAMAAQFAINTIGPAMILRHAGRLMVRDRPSVLAVLSARVGSIGDNRLGGWHSYRAAKAALNQIVRGAAIELARSHGQLACVALHPGTVVSPLTRAHLGRNPAVTSEVAAERLLAVLDGLGPDQTGQFLDWRGAQIPW